MSMISPVTCTCRIISERLWWKVL